MTSPTPTRELTRELVESLRIAFKVGMDNMLIPPGQAQEAVAVFIALCDHYLAPAEREGVVVPREVLERALDALESSYDATEWPANGKSSQEKAARELRALAGREGG